MTNKVQKIREEVVRLKSQLLRGACSSQVAIETRCKEEAYNEVLAILDTMQEEPVSEDLDSFAIKYAQDKPYPVTVCQAVRVGANWQKEQMIAKAVDVTIAVPYQNSEGGYTQLVDSKKGLPFGDKLKVLVIKEN